MSIDRYIARCASDRNPDWPLWYVADQQRGGLNVTGKLTEALTGERQFGGGLFASKTKAMEIARLAKELAL